MTIWSFDPGAVATGVAWLDGIDFYATQFANPIEAWNVLEDEGGRDDVVLIEDYRSGSHLTKEAKATIEIVGFLKYAAKTGWGWGTADPVIRVEQHRLSGQREAAQLMGGTIDELKTDPGRKDAFSALSHCCSYRRYLRMTQ